MKIKRGCLASFQIISALRLFLRSGKSATAFSRTKLSYRYGASNGTRTTVENDTVSLSNLTSGDTLPFEVGYVFLY